MKKFTTILLLMALIFSLFTVNVGAEEENYAKDATWEKGSAKSFEVKDGVCTATNIDAKYRFPYIDILPAITTALGEEDEITIELSFEVKAEFIEGEDTAMARILIRGNNATDLKGPDNIDAWYDAYDEALDGETRFFSNASGNIMRAYETIELSDDWTEHYLTIELTADQIKATAAVNKWYFTLDNVEAFDILKSVSFKNVKVLGYTEDEVPEETPEPTPEPTEKPVEATKAPATEATKAPATEATKAPATEATKAPEASAPTTETEAPSKTPEAGNDSSAIITCAIICAVIIIGSLVAAVIIVKKKTSDK